MQSCWGSEWTAIKPTTCSFAALAYRIAMWLAAEARSLSEGVGYGSGVRTYLVQGHCRWGGSIAATAGRWVLRGV